MIEILKCHDALFTVDEQSNGLSFPAHSSTSDTDNSDDEHDESLKRRLNHQKQFMSNKASKNNMTKLQLSADYSRYQKQIIITRTTIIQTQNQMMEIMINLREAAGATMIQTQMMVEMM